MIIQQKCPYPDEPKQRRSQGKPVLIGSPESQPMQGVMEVFPERTWLSRATAKSVFRGAKRTGKAHPDSKDKNENSQQMCNLEATTSRPSPAKHYACTAHHETQHQE
jgi:hypothetical protein